MENEKIPNNGNEEIKKDSIIKKEYNEDGFYISEIDDTVNDYRIKSDNPMREAIENFYLSLYSSEESNGRKIIHGFRKK